MILALICLIHRILKKIKQPQKISAPVVLDDLIAGVINTQTSDYITTNFRV